MKRIIILAALLFPLAVSAQTSYTGIWAPDTEQPTEYFSIHQNGDNIVVATLDAAKAQWSAYEGTLVDNQIELHSIFSPAAEITVRIKFTSATQAQFTILSCNANPGYICALPIDIPLPMAKIY